MQTGALYIVYLFIYCNQIALTIYHLNFSVVVCVFKSEGKSIVFKLVASKLCACISALK